MDQSNIQHLIDMPLGNRTWIGGEIELVRVPGGWIAVTSAYDERAQQCTTSGTFVPIPTGEIV